MEASAADLEIHDGVISVQGFARGPATVARARPHRGGGAGATAGGNRHRTRGDPRVRRRPERLVGRRPRGRGRGRRRDRARQHRPVRGGRGLRAAGQPRDRGGPDPRRCRPGDRCGPARARGVRGRRSVPGVDVHGLPHADDHRRAELRDPPRRHDPHRSGRQLPRCRRRRDDRRPGVSHERDRGRACSRSECASRSNISHPSRILELIDVVPA